jgi:hypothetical protein
MTNRENHKAGRKVCLKMGETEMVMSAQKNERASFRSAGDEAPNMSNILDVLLACLREETETVRRSPAFDLKGSNAMKSRLLYELSRASRGIDAGRLQAGCKEKLLLLKAELRRNAQIVGAHLAAVKEIAELMINAAKKEEADGTYSRPGLTRVHA